MDIEWILLSHLQYPPHYPLFFIAVQNNCAQKKYTSLSGTYLGITNYNTMSSTTNGGREVLEAARKRLASAKSMLDNAKRMYEAADKEHEEAQMALEVADCRGKVPSY